MHVNFKLVNFQRNITLLILTIKMGKDGTKHQKILVAHALGMNAYATERMLQPVLDNLVNLSPSIKFEFHFADAPYMIPLITDIQLPGYASNTHVRLPYNKSYNSLQRREAVLQAVYELSMQKGYEAETLSNKLIPQRISAKNPILGKKKNTACGSGIHISDEDWKIAKNILDTPSQNDHRQARWWTIPGVDAWGGDEYSLHHLWSIIEEHGPFDGFIGISTGAMMGQHIQSLLINENARASEPLCSHLPQKDPFKYTVYLSPFYPQNPQYTPLLHLVNRVRTRCLSIYGANDSMVPACELSQFLCLELSQVCPPDLNREFSRLVCADTIWEHDGEHGVPANGIWAERIAEWIYTSALDTLSRTEAQLRARL